MPDEQTMNSILSSYGVNSSVTSTFTFANIMAWIIFGIIGMFAFKYGRKERNYKVLGIGLALMVYPYFVSHTILLYVVGVVLSSLLYFWKD